jgi:hypothetical protein
MRARARRRRREMCSWEKPTRAAMVSGSGSWRNRRGRRRGHQIAKTGERPRRWCSSSATRHSRKARSLSGAGHLQPPAGVTEVALELADHAGHGVCPEPGAVAGVVAEVLDAGPAAAADVNDRMVRRRWDGDGHPVPRWTGPPRGLGGRAASAAGSHRLPVAGPSQTSGGRRRPTVEGGSISRCGLPIGSGEYRRKSHNGILGV